MIRRLLPGGVTQFGRDDKSSGAGGGALGGVTGRFGIGGVKGSAGGGGVDMKSSNFAATGAVTQVDENSATGKFSGAGAPAVKDTVSNR